MEIEKKSVQVLMTFEQTVSKRVPLKIPVNEFTFETLKAKSGKLNHSSKPFLQKDTKL